MYGTYGAACHDADTVKSSRQGWQIVRSRMAIVLVILLSLQSWAAVSLPEAARTHVGAWVEAPFRDVAVLEPFSHQTFADYSDVAVIINNQSEVVERLEPPLLWHEISLLNVSYC